MARRKICRNVSYAGYSTKVVGSISQTVQVVYNCVASGTMHLKAKDIRNLTNLFGVYCIAGKKRYNLLTDNFKADDTSETSEHVLDNSSDDSADDIVQNGDDTPRTERRNRKKGY